MSQTRTPFQVLRAQYAVRWPSSTQTRPWRFRSRMAGVLCKLPFTEVVEKSRIRCQRSLRDFYQRREQDCSRPAAFKNATVRERPDAAIRDFPIE
jgi:hypothetical protein